MTMEQVYTTEIRRWPHAATGGFVLPLGNQKVAYGAFVNSGFDAWVEIYKYDNIGNVEYSWRVDPRPEPTVGVNKGDGCSACIVRYPDGRVAMRVLVFSHFTDASTGRPFIMGAADILNTGAIFEPGNPAHFDNVAPLPLAPGSTEVTPAEIEAIAQRSATLTTNALHTAFGGNIRQGIEDKCKDAIQEEGVLRESTVYTSPGLYNRIKETTYESIRNWFSRSIIERLTGSK